LATTGLVTARFYGCRLRQGQAMGQQLQASQLHASQLQSWRSAGDERLWLSMLIETMEEVSRPELRRVPCDSSILAAFRAHLALPASAYGLCGSQFSLRN
jgi:hypothetical protein